MTFPFGCAIRTVEFSEAAHERFRVLRLRPVRAYCSRGGRHRELIPEEGASPDERADGDSGALNALNISRFEPRLRRLTRVAAITWPTPITNRRILSHSSRSASTSGRCGRGSVARSYAIQKLPAQTGFLARNRINCSLRIVNKNLHVVSTVQLEATGNRAQTLVAI